MENKYITINNKSIMIDINENRIYYHDFEEYEEHEIKGLERDLIVLQR